MATKIYVSDRNALHWRTTLNETTVWYDKDYCPRVITTLDHSYVSHIINLLKRSVEELARAEVWEEKDRDGHLKMMGDKDVWLEETPLMKALRAQWDSTV